MLDRAQAVVGFLLALAVLAFVAIVTLSELAAIGGNAGGIGAPVESVPIVQPRHAWDA